MQRSPKIRIFQSIFNDNSVDIFFYSKEPPEQNNKFVRIYTKFINIYTKYIDNDKYLISLFIPAQLLEDEKYKAAIIKKFGHTKYVNYITFFDYKNSNKEYKMCRLNRYSEVLVNTLKVINTEFFLIDDKVLSEYVIDSIQLWFADITDVVDINMF